MTVTDIIDQYIAHLSTSESKLSKKSTAAEVSFFLYFERSFIFLNMIIAFTNSVLFSVCPFYLCLSLYNLSFFFYFSYSYPSPKDIFLYVLMVALLDDDANIIFFSKSL